jgi:hypothetical protein
LKSIFEKLSYNRLSIPCITAIKLKSPEQLITIILSICNANERIYIDFVGYIYMYYFWRYKRRGYEIKYARHAGTLANFLLDRLICGGSIVLVGVSVEYWNDTYADFWHIDRNLRIFYGKYTRSRYLI